ncbi:MAG: sodium:solute symporter family protein [Verrucomicrobiota bacterium]|nr:sodium:solute symporter family protein [Verrucomicrobiota bacterium]
MDALTNATSQTNFSTLDWVIVGVYLLFSVGIAFFVKRYAGNMTNFVTAGRAVGTWLGIATLTGTEMGLITVMYSAQKGFTSGFAAFHIGVSAGLVALLIGLTGFIVVRLREHKVLTIPEYYEKRYGRRTRILGGVMLAFGGLLNMGLFLKVGAMFIVGITGMDPDSGALKVVMAALLALVLVYTVIGGMISVVITDYIQFVILSVGILVTGWFAIKYCDPGTTDSFSMGWDNLFETVQTQYKGDSGFNPIASESDFGWEYVAWMFFLGIVNCALWPTAVARALAMESTAALKRQYTWSSISFAIRMIIPALLGTCAFVFVMTKAPDLQAVFFPEETDTKTVDNLYAMPIFLGRILPAGLIGLITAAMIAAFMSTHDGYLLCWSTVITQDIIAPLFKERLDNPTRIRITRILIVLIGLYILYWGLFYPGEDDIWDYMAVTGAIYFTGAFSLLAGGLYWHRASSTGATLALMAGITAVVGLGPVQQAVHPWIPGSIAEREITAVYDDNIEYKAFEEPEAKEDSFLRDMVVDFIMAPFEQAKPWRFNGLKGWTAVVRNAAGQKHSVEVRTNDADAITVDAWPEGFVPQVGDTVSAYKLISGARVGLMTIGFTLFVFILGSLIFPDRKPREATDE